ncbi:Ert1p [Sugiyamaella lignohabitans]|uniref:Ert1p n=1 Tax=Sugiyamaella lignohabitans TaxID=796027 RepID=A0A161HIJ6_9ASCO|nr:Ert1p [Sugiyamaella lignohabitans]ANB10968.1 Ert1p [Sugiyamaella lignohabitans]
MNNTSLQRDTRAVVSLGLGNNGQGPKNDTGLRPQLQSQPLVEDWDTSSSNSMTPILDSSVGMMSSDNSNGNTDRKEVQKNSTHNNSSGGVRKERKEKRPKTSRACIHCQTAHVTCDSGRPCKRCIKKGLESSCRDGNRKRAKYLAGEDPTLIPESNVGIPNIANASLSPLNPLSSSDNRLLPSIPDNLLTGNPGNMGPMAGVTGQLGNGLTGTIPLSANGQNNGSPPIGPVGSSQNQNSFTPIPQSLEDPFLHNDMSQYSFGSRATNLEYSILSNILRTNIESQHPQLGNQGNQTTTSTPESDISLQGTYFPELKISDFEALDSGSNPLLLPGSQQQQQQQPHQRQSLQKQQQKPQQTQQQELPLPQQKTELNQSNSVLQTQLSNDVIPHRFNSPEEVYQYVRSPFPYTQGFHELIAYLRSRFDKRHLMHMARAMAAYRPSFIATTKLLKEQDLIFMEQCFQRTLMEFEKIIASSGTPTIIWRRTGQIAAVGKEFCILTGWSPERLVSNTTFIVELMDDKSVTDYFDVFSRLAFGDSRGVSMTECTLLKPNGEKVPTACTWTVKRDVFDIPMMIIGNFLPIL